MKIEPVGSCQNLADTKSGLSVDLCPGALCVQ